MKWLDGYRMRIVLIGFVAAIMLGDRTVKADFTFGEPTNLGPTVNSSAGESQPYILADGLALYFQSTRPGGYGDKDLWVTTRPTTNDEWTEPVNLGPTINSSAHDAAPCISADGLALYFHSERPGGYGGSRDLWVTARPTTEDPWTEPANLGPTVNSSDQEGRPCVSSDSLSLYFNSPRPGGFGYDDLYVTTRVTVEDEWGPPANLGPTVNASYNDFNARISAGGELLFFASSNRHGFGLSDLWVTRWEAKNDDWGTPMNVGSPINSSAKESGLGISTDGRTIYFNSDRPGGQGSMDLWQVPIIPIVDLNGDGIVDAADMCSMVDHWGEDESLCDIGPMPWGDGTVDVEDLKILAEHLFEDVSDPTLIAHWSLDEAQGVVAYDSSTYCDGVLFGDPAWQPDGGMVAGALQFDGIDDYVSTDPVLNPADGVFSVVAWIKGGAPGQAILSQVDGASWLRADSTEGNLMTDISDPITQSRRGTEGGLPLISPAVITDGDWHRIGFVWDGSNRILYVDDVVVAEDTLSNLAGASGGLHIGTGSNLEQGTFWSGLIDDVRIYDRVVWP